MRNIFIIVLLMLLFSISGCTGKSLLENKINGDNVVFTENKAVRGGNFLAVKVTKSDGRVIEYISSDYSNSFVANETQLGLRELRILLPGESLTSYTYNEKSLPEKAKSDFNNLMITLRKNLKLSGDEVYNRAIAATPLESSPVK